LRVALEVASRAAEGERLEAALAALEDEPERLRASFDR
jgi:hypothetical protein